MLYQLTLALGLLSSAAMADYTTTLLVLSFDSPSVDGSVIASDATATTYSLACATAVDADNCGIPPGFTMAQGPSTMFYRFESPTNEDGGSGVVQAECQITSDHGVCSATVQGTLPGGRVTSEATTKSYSNYGLDIGALVVTITADLPGAAASSAAIPSTAAMTTSAEAGQTASSFSGPSTATSLSTGSSRVSTAGMPAITVKAQWVIGGAAAAVAIAAM